MRNPAPQWTLVFLLAGVATASGAAPTTPNQPRTSSSSTKPQAEGLTHVTSQPGTKTNSEVVSVRSFILQPGSNWEPPPRIHYLNGIEDEVKKAAAVLTGELRVSKSTPDLDTIDLFVRPQHILVLGEFRVREVLTGNPDAENFSCRWTVSLPGAGRGRGRRPKDDGLDLSSYLGPEGEGLAHVLAWPSTHSWPGTNTNASALLVTGFFQHAGSDWELVHTFPESGTDSMREAVKGITATMALPDTLEKVPKLVAFLEQGGNERLGRYAIRTLLNLPVPWEPRLDALVRTMREKKNPAQAAFGIGGITFHVLNDGLSELDQNRCLDALLALVQATDDSHSLRVTTAHVRSVAYLFRHDHIRAEALRQALLQRRAKVKDVSAAEERAIDAGLAPLLNTPESEWTSPRASERRE